ncbi:cation transporting ATPase C-terminal domain-containing protein [Candidatus Curtissbacteria bacterium]|nr:cation transporting ATPase C-terminal domain-containing protein [Candidatus Curtissbacteria bacterium]
MPEVWFNALNVRSKKKSVFATSVTNNWYLLAALAIVAILQYGAIQTNFGNKLLHTTDLKLEHWLLAFLVSLLIIFVEEVRKLFVRTK